MTDLPTFDEIMCVIHARRRLQVMVDENRNSYETKRYIERRTAALKYTRARA